MCPVCILTTAGLSIISGLITTTGLSAVALTKPVIRTSRKRATAPRESGRKGLAPTPELKTQAGCARQ